jgi:hypothetical protein
MVERARLLLSRILWVVELMVFREPLVHSVFYSAPDAPLTVLISQKVSSLSSHLHLWALSTVNGSSLMPQLLPLPLPSPLPPGIQLPLGTLPRHPPLPARQPPPLRPLPLPPPRHRPPAVHRHQLPALLVLTAPRLPLLVTLLTKARTSPTLSKSSSSSEALLSLDTIFNTTYDYFSL